MAEDTTLESVRAWEDRHRAELDSQRKDVFTTSSGREVKPVYTPADLVQEDFEFARDLGHPGDPPFARGERATGYRGKLWSWEFYAGFGAAADANQRYRYLIETGGTGGVSIALDLPTQIGIDADHPDALYETGRVGVAINTLKDVVDLFDGIDLSRAGKIFTTGNSIGPLAVAWFYELASIKGEDPSSFVVTVQNDPLKEYVARGTQFLPVAAAMRLACDAVQFCVERDLPWYPISISGAHMKQAGGSCAQEAAFTIANGIAYMDELQKRGLAMDKVARHVELHFSTDMDFFEEVAKYRVARRVWTEILRDRYQVEGIAPRIHGVASGAPLTAQQPKNNIVRITMEVLAQVFGGVSQTRTACYDEALAIPTEDAVKLAIRTNQILAHETGIADTVDPLGGSYFLETLTAQMYSEVLSILATVHDMGGAIAAIDSGWFADELAAGAYRQQMELECGRRLVVGVTDFVEEEIEPTPAFPLDAGAGERQRQRLEEFKTSRDSGAVEASMKAMESALKQGRNSVPLALDALRAGATLGETCGVWKQTFGEWSQYGPRS